MRGCPGLHGDPRFHLLVSRWLPLSFHPQDRLTSFQDCDGRWVVEAQGFTAHALHFAELVSVGEGREGQYELVHNHIPGFASYLCFYTYPKSYGKMFY